MSDKDLGFSDIKHTNFTLNECTESLHKSYEDKWAHEREFHGWGMKNSSPLSNTSGYLYFTRQVPVNSVGLMLHELFSLLLDNTSGDTALQISKYVHTFVHDDSNADNILIATDILLAFDDYSVQYQIVFNRDSLDAKEFFCEIVMIFGQENIDNRRKLADIGTKITIQ